jgi:hypothetical protein
MKASAIEAQHDAYFVQKLWVGDELLGRNRFDVFREICERRRVLHVGCVDWPITSVESNLHLHLDRHCAALDGFDVHEEAFATLRPHLRGRLYSRWEQVRDEYDVVLVPEVLEHVPNVAEFLAEIDRLSATHVVITVPDAYQCYRRHFDYDAGSKAFVEVVHPDHNNWYTPYTLSNTIAKYTNWSLQGMWFFNGISLLTIATKQR